MRSKMLILSATLLFGCGRMTTENREHVLDGVKQIEKGIRDGHRKEDTLQDLYRLDRTHRLLLRLEDLMDHVPHISVEGERKVVLKMVLTGGGGPDIRLCPLTKQWMLLATWYRAHNLTKEAIWSKEGGDFDESLCVNPALRSSGFQEFDVTQWFLNYTRGRKVNYGFILMAEVPTTVIGDNGSAQSPRLSFEVTRELFSPRN